MLEANKSFYNSLIWLSGLLMGFGHFSILNDLALVYWSTWAPYLVAPMPLIYLITKKSRVKDSYVVSLARPWGHMLADNLISAALVSTFAILTFLINRNALWLLLSNQISRTQVILALNFVAYVIGMYLLSYYAKAERRKELLKFQNNRGEARDPVGA